MANSVQRRKGQSKFEYSRNRSIIILKFIKMAMIELQAAAGEDPAIQWDDTVTTITGQSDDAQAWVGENILNTEPVNTDETVHSVVQDVDWDRIKSQLYTTADFTLDVVRTYKTVESCAVASATYTLATV